MKLIGLTFLCLFSMLLIAYSQEKTVSDNKSKVVLDKNKPSVYITFERLGGNKPIAKSNEANLERISLRLHNNTKHPITIEANYYVDKIKDFAITLWDDAKVNALPDGAEVDVCYEAEAMPQMTAEEFFKIKIPNQIPSYQSCKLQITGRGRGNRWIPSGYSIVFSVPRSFLAKNLKIYTLFNYEWESENGQMNANEPYHQVYFYSNELPFDLQEK